MKFRRLALYTMCIIEAVVLIYLSRYLYGFRPVMSQYQALEMVPPMRNVIATSLLFIFGSPLVPSVGAFTAWRVRKRFFAEAQLLVVAAVFGALLMLFVFWFKLNLFEGVSFVGALDRTFHYFG